MGIKGLTAPSKQIILKFSEVYLPGLGPDFACLSGRLKTLLYFAVCEKIKLLSK